MRLTKGYYWNPSKYESFEEFIAAKNKRRRKNYRHTKVIYRYEEVRYRGDKVWEGFSPYNIWNEPLPGSENKVAEFIELISWRTIEKKHIPLLTLWFLGSYFIFYDSQTLNLYGAYHLICVDHHNAARNAAFKLLMLEPNQSPASLGSSASEDIRGTLLEIVLAQ